MKSGVKARLTWVPYGQGGRAHAPTGTTYTTVARYHHPVTHEISFEWSMVVHFNNELRSVESQHVSVSFLSLEAPHALLQPGFMFELYEGARLVAVGEVIDEIEAPVKE